MSEWIRTLGIVLVIILFVIAVILIFNTIKATLANREEEIHIMKYIGATNGYIRRPLLMEGLFFGIIASGIALAVVYHGYEFLFTKVQDRLQIMLNYSLVDPELVLTDVGIIFLCLGVGIGLLGSSFSVKRYLKV